MPKLTKQQKNRLVHGVLPSDKTCSICLNKCKTMVTLHKVEFYPWRKVKTRQNTKVCNHVFCRDCMKRWAKSSSTFTNDITCTCPNCREGFNAFVTVGTLTTFYAINMSWVIKLLAIHEHLRKLLIQDIGQQHFSMKIWNQLNQTHLVAIKRFEDKYTGQKFKDRYPVMHQFFHTVNNKIKNN